MHSYLQVGRTGGGDTGAVVSFCFFSVPVTSEDAGENVLLEIPEHNLTLVGHKYLGSVSTGVTVLGDDYLTRFEAPPAFGCWWDGKEWVTPEAAPSEPAPVEPTWSAMTKAEIAAYCQDNFGETLDTNQLKDAMIAQAHDLWVIAYS